MWQRVERFRDRRQAGIELARQLSTYARQPHTLILALPRGGVPVAFEVARALELPMDVFLVRKLGVPGHEEYAMGAIASGGFRFLNRQVVQQLGLSAEAVDRVVEKEEEELARREITYGFTPPVIEDRNVILIDDGFATGSSMKVAIDALRTKSARKIVVAAPVGSPDTCAALRSFADEVTCAVSPEDFQAVGQFYDDFSQTTDVEVRQLLDEVRSSAGITSVRGWQ